MVDLCPMWLIVVFLAMADIRVNPARIFVHEFECR